LEHKSEENGKVLIFLAGTVEDSVKKDSLTVSREKWMTGQRKRDGIKSRASRVIFGDGLEWNYT
jgi:hypothetical protein